MNLDRKQTGCDRQRLLLLFAFCCAVVDARIVDASSFFVLFSIGVFIQIFRFTLVGANRFHFLDAFRLLSFFFIKVYNKKKIRL